MANSNDITIKPGVGASLSYGWERMKANFLAFFLIVFLLSLLDFPMELMSGKSGLMHHDISASLILLQVLGTAYFFLLLPIFDYSGDLIFLKGVRGEKVNVKEIAIGFNNYVNIVLANLLVFGLVGIALVALIIPGIIVGCRLAFVSYLVMDKGLDPIEAVETSWKLTRGHGWKVFGLGLLSIFIAILGLAMVIVGIFPAVMWIKASFASLYLSILQEKGDDYFPPASDSIA